MTKILVIEDADPLRNDILEMLSYEGFEVMGAENGLVGVEAARSYHPDLIVCDIMMPELDGYEVLEALRRDGKTAAIPFIFLTAKTDRVDVRHGMRLGADDYLTKPFMAAELLEAIHTRLEKRAALNKLAQAKLQDLSESLITALPHELRTPLNTIMGFSDMLVSEAYRIKPAQIAEWGDHINASAQRLYRLVENYLTYARIETIAVDPAKLSQLRNKQTDPETTIQVQVLHKAQQYGREADVKLKTAGGCKITIAEQDFAKIVEELVDNAFKFSPPRSPVTVEAWMDGGMYVLQIADAGRGMTQEQIISIGAYMQFERWIYEQQGSGLGMVIASRLVELCGGAFEARSSNGLVVTVRLPLA